MDTNIKPIVGGGYTKLDPVGGKFIPHTGIDYTSLSRYLGTDVHYDHVVNQEHRRAEAQSKGQRVGHGALRFLSGVGFKSVEQAGYVATALPALLSWDMSVMTENAFSKAISEYEGDVKDLLPIYKTKKYLEGDLLDQLGSLSFWMDEGMDGLAFAIAAFAPGALLTRGLKVGAGVSKLITGVKGRQLGNIVDGATRMQTALNSAEVAAPGIFGKLVGPAVKALKNPAFVERGVNYSSTVLYNTIGEAGVEAAHNHEAIIDSLIAHKYGEGTTRDDLSQEELDKIKVIAADRTRAQFWGNFRTLMASNALTTYMILGKMPKASKAVNEAVRSGTQVAKKSTWDLIKTTVPKNVGLGVLSEGLYEENIQYVMEKRAQLSEEEYGGGLMSKDFLKTAADVVEGMTEFSGDMEHSKAIILGAVLGSIMGSIGGVREAIQQNKQDAAISSFIASGRSILSGYNDFVERNDKGEVININVAELAAKVSEDLKAKKIIQEMLDLDGQTGDLAMKKRAEKDVRLWTNHALRLFSSPGGKDLIKLDNEFQLEELHKIFIASGKSEEEAGKWVSAIRKAREDILPKLEKYWEFASGPLTQIATPIIGEKNIHNYQGDVYSRFAHIDQLESVASDITELVGTLDSAYSSIEDNESDPMSAFSREMLDIQRNLVKANQEKINNAIEKAKKELSYLLSEEGMKNHAKEKEIIDNVNTQRLKEAERAENRKKPVVEMVDSIIGKEKSHDIFDSWRDSTDSNYKGFSRFQRALSTAISKFNNKVKTTKNENLPQSDEEIAKLFEDLIALEKEDIRMLGKNSKDLIPVLRNMIEKKKSTKTTTSVNEQRDDYDGEVDPLSEIFDTKNPEDVTPERDSGSILFQEESKSENEIKDKASRATKAAQKALSVNQKVTTLVNTEGSIYEIKRVELETKAAQLMETASVLFKNITNEKTDELIASIETIVLEINTMLSNMSENDDPLGISGLIDEESSNVPDEAKFTPATNDQRRNKFFKTGEKFRTWGSKMNPQETGAELDKTALVDGKALAIFVHEQELTGGPEFTPIIYHSLFSSEVDPSKLTDEDIANLKFEIVLRHDSTGILIQLPSTDYYSEGRNPYEAEGIVLAAAKKKILQAVKEGKNVKVGLRKDKGSAAYDVLGEMEFTITDPIAIEEFEKNNSLRGLYVVRRKDGSIASISSPAKNNISESFGIPIENLVIGVGVDTNKVNINGKATRVDSEVVSLGSPFLIIPISTDDHSISNLREEYPIRLNRQQFNSSRGFVGILTSALLDKSKGKTESNLTALNGDITLRVIGNTDAIIQMLSGSGIFSVDGSTITYKPSLEEEGVPYDTSTPEGYQKFTSLVETLLFNVDNDTLSKGSNIKVEIGKETYDLSSPKEYIKMLVELNMLTTNVTPFSERTVKDKKYYRIHVGRRLGISPDMVYVEEAEKLVEETVEEKTEYTYSEALKLLVPSDQKVEGIEEFSKLVEELGGRVEMYDPAKHDKSNTDGVMERPSESWAWTDTESNAIVVDKSRLPEADMAMLISLLHEGTHVIYTQNEIYNMFPKEFDDVFSYIFDQFPPNAPLDTHIAGIVNILRKAYSANKETAAQELFGYLTDFEFVSWLSQQTKEEWTQAGKKKTLFDKVLDLLFKVVNSILKLKGHSSLYTFKKEGTLLGNITDIMSDIENYKPDSSPKNLKGLTDNLEGIFDIETVPGTYNEFEEFDDNEYDVSAAAAQLRQEELETREAANALFGLALTAMKFQGLNNMAISNKTQEELEKEGNPRAKQILTKDKLIKIIDHVISWHKKTGSGTAMVYASRLEQLKENIDKYIPYMFQRMQEIRMRSTIIEDDASVEDVTGNDAMFDKDFSKSSIEIDIRNTAAGKVWAWIASSYPEYTEEMITEIGVEESPTLDSFGLPHMVKSVDQIMALLYHKLHNASSPYEMLDIIEELTGYPAVMRDEDTEGAIRWNTHDHIAKGTYIPYLQKMLSDTRKDSTGKSKVGEDMLMALFNAFHVQKNEFWVIDLISYKDHNGIEKYDLKISKNNRSLFERNIIKELERGFTESALYDKNNDAISATTLQHINNLISTLTAFRVEPGYRVKGTFIDFAQNPQEAETVEVRNQTTDTVESAISYILNSIGIPIEYATYIIISARKSLDYRSILDSIKTIVSQAEALKGAKMADKSIFTSAETYTTTLKLVSIISEELNVPSPMFVHGAKGSKYSTFSQHTSFSRIWKRLKGYVKALPEHKAKVDRLRKSSPNSILIKRAINGDALPDISTVVAVGTGEFATRNKYEKISEYDDTLTRLLLGTMKDSYFPVSQGDRKHSPLFQNPNWIQSDIAVDEKTGKVNSAAVRVFVNHFKDHVNRVSNAVAHIVNGGELIDGWSSSSKGIKKITIARKDGTKVSFYPGPLFTYGAMPELSSYIKVSSKGIVTYSKEDEILSKIENALNKKIEQHISRLKDLGIIKEDGKSKYLTREMLRLKLVKFKAKGYDFSWINNPQQSSDAAISSALVGDYVINTMITGLEYEAITGNKFDLFKNDPDRRDKRASTNQTTGVSHTSSGTFTSSAVKDLMEVLSSDKIQQIEKLIHNSREAISRATGIPMEDVISDSLLGRIMTSLKSPVTATDGGALISLKRFEQILKDNGELDSIAIEALKILAIPMEVELTAQEKTILGKFAATALKTANMGSVPIHGDTSYLIQKMAEFVVAPRFIPANSLLMDIYERMTLTGRYENAEGLEEIHQLAPESVFKSILPEVGNIEALDKLKTVELEEENHFKIHEVRNHELSAGKLTTQLLKNVLTSIILDGEYAGKKGEDVIRDLNATASALVEKQYDSLIRSLLDPASGIVSKHKLLELLKKTMSMSPEMENAIKIGIPIEVLTSNREFQYAIFSIIDKRIRSINIPSLSLTQVPEFGRTRLKVFGEDNEWTGEYTSPAVSVQISETEFSFDCIVTEKVVNKIFPDNLKNADFNKKRAWVKENAGKVRFIATRVPTSKPTLIAHMNVIDIMPESAGDNIIVPALMVNLFGADFDIDKLFTYHYTYDSNGNVIPFLDDSNSTARTRFDAFYADRKNRRILKDLFGSSFFRGDIDVVEKRDTVRGFHRLQVRAQKAEKKIAEINSQLVGVTNKSEIRKLKRLKRSASLVVEDYYRKVNDEAFIESLESYEDSIPNKDRATADQYNLVKSWWETLSIHAQNTSAALSNHLLDIMAQSISSPYNALTAFTPTEAESVKKIHEEINGYETEVDYGVEYDYYTPDRTIQSRRELNAANACIAIFANYMSAIGIEKTTNNYLVIPENIIMGNRTLIQKLGLKYNSETNSYIFDLKKTVYDKGESVVEDINDLIVAVLDTKEGYVSKLNISEYTAPALALAVRLGMAKWGYYLINQPSVKEISKWVENVKGEFFDAPFIINEKEKVVPMRAEHWVKYKLAEAILGKDGLPKTRVKGKEYVDFSKIDFGKFVTSPTLEDLRRFKYQIDNAKTEEELKEARIIQFRLLDYWVRFERFAKAYGQTVNTGKSDTSKPGLFSIMIDNEIDNDKVSRTSPVQGWNRRLNSSESYIGTINDLTSKAAVQIGSAISLTLSRSWIESRKKLIEIYGLEDSKAIKENLTSAFERSFLGHFFNMVISKRDEVNNPEDEAVRKKNISNRKKDFIRSLMLTNRNSAAKRLQEIKDKIAEAKKNNEPYLYPAKYVEILNKFIISSEEKGTIGTVGYNRALSKTEESIELNVFEEMMDHEELGPILEDVIIAEFYRGGLQFGLTTIPFPINYFLRQYDLHETLSSYKTPISLDDKFDEISAAILKIDNSFDVAESIVSDSFDYDICPIFSKSSPYILDIQDGKGITVSEDAVMFNSRTKTLMEFNPEKTPPITLIVKDKDKVKNYVLVGVSRGDKKDFIYSELKVLRDLHYSFTGITNLHRLLELDTSAIDMDNIGSIAHVLNNTNSNFRSVLRTLDKTQNPMVTDIRKEADESHKRTNEKIDTVENNSRLDIKVMPNITHNFIKPGVSELFESNPELANSVYEALGFTGNIIQDNKSYYRGQIEQPTIDKNGNLVLYAKEDELYKRAGLKSKGVSMADNLKSAIDYGNGQLEVAQNLASETYDSEKELQKLSDNGYYLIQIPKDISNEVVKEAGEVKIVGDKIIIPKGQYKIEQVIDGVESEITPQQKQQAQQLYSQYLDTIFPDSKVKDIVYHGTSKDFTGFIKGKQVTTKGITKGGIWFTDFANADWVYKEEDGKVIPALINVKNPIEYNTERFFDKQYGDSLPTKELKEGQWKDVQKLLNDRKGDGLILDIFDATTSGDVGEFTKQQVVFEPEQIHILGSKQDVEGFKDFVDKGSVLSVSTIAPLPTQKKLDMNYDSTKLNTLEDVIAASIHSLETTIERLKNSKESYGRNVLEQKLKQILSKIETSYEAKNVVDALSYISYVIANIRSIYQEHYADKDPNIASWTEEEQFDYASYLGNSIGVLGGMLEFEKIYDLQKSNPIVYGTLGEAVKLLNKTMPIVRELRAFQLKLFENYHESLLRQYTNDPEILYGMKGIFDMVEDETFTQRWLDSAASSNVSYLSLLNKRLNMILMDHAAMGRDAVALFKRKVEEYEAAGGNIMDIVAKDKDGNFIPEIVRQYGSDEEIEKEKTLRRELRDMEDLGVPDAPNYKDYFKKRHEYEELLRNIKHAPYTDEYYEFRNSLDEDARIELDRIQYKIYKLRAHKHSFSTDGVVDKEYWTEAELEELHNLERERTFLRLYINQDGTRKAPGTVEYKIAESFRKSEYQNKLFGDILTRETDMESFEKARQDYFTRFGETDPQKYYKWLYDNTDKLQLTSAFWDALAGTGLFLQKLSAEEIKDRLNLSRYEHGATVADAIDEVVAARDGMSAMEAHADWVFYTLQNTSAAIKQGNKEVLSNNYNQLDELLTKANEAEKKYHNSLIKLRSLGYMLPRELELDLKAVEELLLIEQNADRAKAITNLLGACQVNGIISESDIEALKKKMVVKNANVGHSTVISILSRFWSKKEEGPNGEKYIASEEDGTFLPKPKWSKWKVSDKYINPEYEDNLDDNRNPKYKNINPEFKRRNLENNSFYSYYIELMNSLTDHAKNTYIRKVLFPLVPKDYKFDKETKKILKQEKRTGVRFTIETDNEIIRTVPFMYVSKIEPLPYESIPEEASKDEIQAIKERNRAIAEKNKEIHKSKINMDLKKTMEFFIMEAMKSKAKAKMEPEIYGAGFIMDDMDVMGKSGLVDKIYHRLKKNVPYSFKGKSANFKRHYEDFVRMQFYEEFNNEENLAEFAALIQKWNSILGIGLNIFSAPNNKIYGEFQNMIEAGRYGHYSRSDYAWAKMVYNQQFALIASNRRNDVNRTVEEALIKDYGIMSTQDEYYIQSGADQIGQFTNWKMLYDSLFFLQNAGEHSLQNQVLLAMSKSNRIMFDTQENKWRIFHYNQFLREMQIRNKDLSENNRLTNADIEGQFNALPTVRDMLDLDGNGRMIIKEEYAKQGITMSLMSEFRNKAFNVKNDLHGVYDKMNAGAIQKYALGRLALQFRRWMRKGWARRFGHRFGESYFRESTAEYDNAMYINTAKFLYEIGKEIALFRFRFGSVWNQMDGMQRADFVRTVNEMTVFFSLMALSSLAFAAGWDDDAKKNRRVAFLLYNLTRARKEILTYSFNLYGESRRTLANPFPAMNALHDFAKLGWYSIAYPFQTKDQRDIDAGIYKGHTHVEKYFWKNIPVAKHWYWRYKFINEQPEYSMFSGTYN